MISNTERSHQLHMLAQQARSHKQASDYGMPNLRPLDRTAVRHAPSGFRATERRKPGTRSAALWWNVTSEHQSPPHPSSGHYPDPTILSTVNSPICLAKHQLPNRTFLLGNEGGFVVYLPVEQNIHDRTLFPTKWFGASEFGRKFIEADVVWMVRNGMKTHLDRTCQTGFVQELGKAQRIFEVETCTIRQTFFVPNGCRAMVMTLEADESVEFVIAPEFDMRYYQAFNSDFTRYTGSTGPRDGTECLRVTNCVRLPGADDNELTFFAIVGSSNGNPTIRMLPEDRRLNKKTYLKDEEREKAIVESYRETHQTMQTSPDEAPIWDTYSTMIYAPAEITASSSVTLIYAFGDGEEGAEDTFNEVRCRLAGLQDEKVEDNRQRLLQGALSTGVADIDRAYQQVFIRFNTSLVARDITIKAGSYDINHWSAIFAGNKYFLDAWKRDENISLIALLATSDYAAVCDILTETWRLQDKRTGRLPHIIRLGEPLKYYSSDGTLWALRRLFQYTRATGNTHLLDDKYHMVEHFFTASLNFVKRGLLPSGGIIDKSYLWETWEDTPYTPRDGYPVEIELLWLTALMNYLPTFRDRNPRLASLLEAILQEGRETFKLFHLDGYLADSLSYDWQPRTTLTPNGYMAFGLDYPLPADLRHGMVLLGREQLAGKVGIRSLAPRDWKDTFSPEFMADEHNFRNGHMASVGIYNYHRGIEWLWLNQFFIQAELTCGSTDTAYEAYLSGQVHEALHEGGVGGLSELYDMRGPLGADFQAWSMASFIAGLHAFAGITVDAIDRYIHVRPAIPEKWPHLQARQQVGSTRYDLRYSKDHLRQTIEIDAVDPVPAGYTLRVGVRVPAGRSVASVEVGGETIPRECWQREPGCAPGAEYDLWVQSPFTKRTVARFTLGTE